MMKIIFFDDYHEIDPFIEKIQILDKNYNGFELFDEYELPQSLAQYVDEDFKDYIHEKYSEGHGSYAALIYTGKKPTSNEIGNFFSRDMIIFVFERLEVN